MKNQMNVSNAIIDELNKDEKARLMLARFKELAEQHGITGEEYDKAHQSVLMNILATRRDLVEMMGREYWNEVNGVNAC